MNKQNASNVDSLESNVLNEKDAAKYIGMSVSYLQKDRMNGAIANRTPGPKWIKIGKRVLYSKQALSEWLEEHTVSRKPH